jgi:hypothetical protein
MPDVARRRTEELVDERWARLADVFFPTGTPRPCDRYVRGHRDRWSFGEDAFGELRFV